MKGNSVPYGAAQRRCFPFDFVSNCDYRMNGSGDSGIEDFGP